ncbi:glycerol-3-phosphate acyltransferase [Viridibacillus sp. YIM B01967]|uniref:Glycerol-3-phosphate acyltransferase n=1 Tax=Viridibacillus soli TaxID=2798301 RepID=A0ABS1H7W2_9BACL|nr:glycerol-3-phosphate acyltransferase [Viridibacillus soli]MBK3495491.1 glycerol-3-phosphate acyltransferase [Viridibacillus soli]
MFYFTICYWVISYFVGTMMTAWWIGKWKKIDLREHRSGNLGARNAGAVIGKPAFFLTFFGDGSKGALIVLLGYLLDESQFAITVAGALVIVGHLFPIWLKGKGGKGIATFIGVALSLDPLLFVSFVVGFLFPFPFLKSATLSMLIGYVCYVLWIIYVGMLPVASPIVLIILIILYKHRFDIKESYQEKAWQSKKGE